METIKEALLNLWQWVLQADEQTLYTALILITTSTIFSYVLQHIKRTTKIDLLEKGKTVVVALLGVLSTIGALADWYLIQPQNFTGHFFGYGTAIFTLATIVHRIHVSPTYDKLVRVFTKFSDNVATTRDAKYSKPATPVQPVADERRFQ